MSNARTIQGAAAEALDQQPRRLCCNGVLPRNLRHEDLAARRLVAPGRPTTGTILTATTSTDTRRGLRASAPGEGDNEALLFQRSTVL
jgi:hypothetical protein